MHSNPQIFPHFCTARGTLLRSPPSIDFPEELSSLPAQVLDDGSKLTESCVKHVFSQHTFCTDSVVQVFHEDHIASITKSVSLLEVKILASVVNCVVKSRNFNPSLLVILGALLFSLESALQHFQPTLQTLKKLRRLYEDPVASCQKLLQPHIYPERMTVGNGVGNADITLDIDRSVPLVGTPRDSHLLDNKSTRYGSVQVDGDCSNLRQFNVQVCQWILLKLRKQQRFELPVFLESGKAKLSVLEVFPTSMKLFNRLLDNLRRNLTEYRKFFLGSRQVVKLVDNARKLQVSRQDVFFFNRAFINRTLTAIAPIFDLSKRIVVSGATDFHPLNKRLFLSGIWIYAIAVVKCQHSLIIGFNGHNATVKC